RGRSRSWRGSARSRGPSRRAPSPAGWPRRSRRCRAVRVPWLRAPLLGVDVLDGLVRLREGALEPEVHSLLHLVAGSLRDAVRLLRADRPVRDEPRAEPRDRVAALRRLILLRRAEDLD